MLETEVIGNKEWATGFLCEEDIRHLESFDSEMRDRQLQKTRESGMAKTYDQLVQEGAFEMPTHCEHGIPLYRACEMCWSFLERRRE